MKILFYINTLSHGGAERVITNLCGAFAARGYETVLVTSYPEKWEYSVNSETKRINLTDRRIDGFLKRNFKLVKLLKKTVKAEKPDVVVSFMAEPNYRAIIAAGKKTKTVISVRNDPNREYPSKLHRFLARHLYKKADGVVFQTDDAKKWFPEKIQKKSRVIMNQIDDRFFEANYDGERKDIVATGRLTDQKNHRVLIDAFSKISHKVNDDLVIYGEGELRETLETYIAEKGLVGRVRLPGATNDVPSAIKAARLYVLSSDYEGMPNALVEAMALGLPVVSTDCSCGGPKALLGEFGDKYLVPVGDSEALAKSMLKILSSSAEETDGIRALIRQKAQACRGDRVICDWELFINEVCK